MRKRFPTRIAKIGLLLLFTLFAGIFSNVRSVSAQTPVVRAVLFYSPSCGHCYKVITEDLPPLTEKYGEQLVLVTINTQTEEGRKLFINTLESFNIPLERAGVPFLVVEETILVGSLDIPEKFPGMIEAGLAAGGIDWPQIPGLTDYLQANGFIKSEEETPTEDIPPQDEQPDETQPEISLESDVFKPMSVKQRFLQDVVGNSVSVLVLLGMVVVVFWAMMIATDTWDVRKPWPIGIILLLIVLGIFVSIYMSFVELTHETAVCGPVGDCNTVQQSEYAYLFGIIPIGLLGVVGYSLILLIWAIGYWGPAKLQRIAYLTLFGLTLGGTVFSIYLTYLEPFVIGASCVWCLTSAIVMTLLMWCATQEVALLEIDLA